ncbi:MAG: SDR family NAD(P)-dependent oxidoreductase [Pseudomonadota bacterium]
MTDSSAPDDLAGTVAIVGMAGRFPGARNVNELWRLLREGREATHWASDEELRAAGVSDAEMADPNYVRATLPLPDMEMFDAGFFGIGKRDAAVLDPQHRHFLECCWEALEDAGHLPERFAGAIGVFGGCGMQAYLPYHLLTNPKLLESMGLFLLRHTGNDKDFLTTRVSYLLDLKGPSIGIQTACSTSLVAVHVAAQSLLSGECDMALAGGSSIDLPHRRGYRFAEGEILSHDGHCRAFDDAASGTLFGSGAGIVVLRRTEDALRDGDHIYAVVRGSAVNNDGSGKAGYLAPSVDGQASAAVEALAVAGVEPASVAYVEAHGTGTPVGDPIEVAALTQAYGPAGPGALGLGSLKTNIGHLDTAAGVASLIKVCQALRHGVLPPSLNFHRANSHFDAPTMPFRIVDQPRGWARGDAPRLAAVNSLGVGGTNAHMIVQEAPLSPRAALADDDWQLFTLSARTDTSLQALRGRWRALLAEPPPEFNLADAAYTTQAGRREFAQRMVVVARDAQGLEQALGEAPQRAPGARGGFMAQGRTDTTAAPVVFLFPGGGAHFPGAGRELMRIAAFREAVQACWDALPADAPADLRERLFAEPTQGPADAAWLEAPSRAIPALFVLEYALGRLWLSWGVKPAAMIGHSAGEYAAACLAGMLSLRDALTLVVLRGRLFEAAPPGGMLSVDLPEAQLRPLAEAAGVDIAAVNAPDLCMVSGAKDALAGLQQRLAGQGVEARRLHIDVAAHSRLLDGIVAAFGAGAAQITTRAPSVPILSTLTGEWITPGQGVDTDYWVRHLRQPVRFADAMQRLLRELPGAALLEVGPGQGLGSLARHNGAAPTQAVLTSTRKADGVEGDLPVMLTSAGALWTRGVALDWTALRGPGERRRIPLPTYAFDHERHWIEPGIGLAVAATAATATPPTTATLADGSRGLPRLPMDDWFHTTQWQPAPLPPVAPGAPVEVTRWLVAGGGTPLGAALVRSLEQQGVPVISVEPGVDFRLLFEQLERDGRLPGQLVVLGALEASADSPDDAVAAAFDTPVRIAQALAQADIAQPMRLMLVTAGSQAVGKGLDAGPAAPLQAMALGPCRVIPRELPQLSCRLVDLDPAESGGEPAVARLLAEAAAPGGGDLAAWRKGQRWQPHRVRAPVGPPHPPGRLREGGVYLITGGLGGIGLELAAYLARNFRARLALVSRRALPDPARWRELAAAGGGEPAHADTPTLARLVALEDAGAQVMACGADVTDAAAMARVVDACRERWGTVHGVFHAAGELGDAPLSAKPLTDMHRLIAVKAGGAWVLHTLLPPGTLDVFAVSSSTSIDLGLAGQVDYVAANAALEALALSRSDGLAIRWGVWADTGMAARAFGVARAIGPSPHPLLGARADEGGEVVFEARYDPASLWVLDEHRVAGRPVLPGTAYIEIARAAMAVLHPGRGVDLRTLSFESAMVFDAGPRRVQARLRPEDGGLAFLVRSRGPGEPGWTEHARATARADTPRLLRAAPTTGPWQEGRAPQARGGALAFGARWNNLARMRLAKRSAVAELALPAEFAGDVTTWRLHPAMADMAATFGLHLLDEAERGNRLYVPVSVDRIRIAAALPSHFTSRVELVGTPGHGMTQFDVSLHDGDGAPLAAFEGFTMRAVDPAALSAARPSSANASATRAEAMVAGGIRMEDAPAVLARVFDSPHAQLTVSSLDLASLCRDMAPPPARAPAASGHPPGPGAAATAGEVLTPMEEAVAQVWRDLLGVERITRDDDFFALGGHSLVAVRLFARLRKQFGADLPLATLFEAPTLGRLAAVVAETATTGLPTPLARQAPKPPRRRRRRRHRT